jgi:hypothetical protein
MTTMTETMNIRGENEAPVRAVDQGTETPEEFEVDDKDTCGHPEDDDADEEEDEEEMAAPERQRRPPNTLRHRFQRAPRTIC